MSHDAIPTQWSVREVRRSVPSTTCDGAPLRCCCNVSTICYFHWHHAVNLDVAIRSIIPAWPARRRQA